LDFTGASVNRDARAEPHHAPGPQTVPADFFGGDEQKFSPTRHPGADRSMLCQIQDGKGKSVSEYLMN
jgi:hypothetical protein